MMSTLYLYVSTCLARMSNRSWQLIQSQFTVFGHLTLPCFFFLFSCGDSQGLAYMAFSNESGNMLQDNPGSINMWDIYVGQSEDELEILPGTDMEVGQDIQKEEDGSVIMRDIFVGHTVELENLLQELTEVQQVDPGTDMEVGQ